VSDRDDHCFVGVDDLESDSIQWLAPLSRLRRLPGMVAGLSARRRRPTRDVTD
jgi:hypothetical protein